MEIFSNSVSELIGPELTVLAFGIVTPLTILLCSWVLYAAFERQRLWAIVAVLVISSAIRDELMNNASHGGERTSAVAAWGIVIMTVLYRPVRKLYDSASYEVKRKSSAEDSDNPGEENDPANLDPVPQQL